MEEQEKFVENLDFASPETFTQSVEISESETVQEDEVEPPKPKSSRRRKKPAVTEEVEYSPSETSVDVNAETEYPSTEKVEPPVLFGIKRFRAKK